MKYLKLVVLASLVAPLCSGTATAAGCKFGNKVLSKVIGSNATDDSRSFTINGTALLAVAGAKDRVGPVDLDVTFSGPGGCREKSGPTVGCTITGSREAKATIKNPKGERVTYFWVCTSLD
ncbi:MAG TPA: hypothetical protein VJ045_09820 [Hyphomicrobiaceae bacterium]|nr:hypothetical protein [Hyphomicrobiaceae bacterium]